MEINNSEVLQNTLPPAPSITPDHPEKLTRRKKASKLIKRITGPIIAFVVLAIVVLNTLIIPAKAMPDAVEPFPNKQLFSEKVTFLVREPAVGDVIIFKPVEGGGFSQFIGIVIGVKEEMNIKTYEVISKPGKAWELTRDKIVSKVYFPKITQAQIDLARTSKDVSETSSNQNYKTYINTAYSYSLEYPGELAPTEEAGTAVDTFIHQTTFAKPSGEYYEAIKVIVSSSSFESEIEHNKVKTVGHVADSIKAEESIKVASFTARRLDYDLLVSPNQSENYSAIIINHPRYTYILVGPQNSINTILPSLSFSANPSVSPATSLKLLDTANWKVASINNVSFKYPPDYITQNTENSVELVATNKPRVLISRYTYGGGSRREWFIERLSKNSGESAGEILRHSLPKEVSLGSVEALDFWQDPSYWQGGYISPIIISSGNTIVTVSISSGRKYNPTTGETTRDILTDTIGSTARFTSD